MFSNCPTNASQEKLLGYVEQQHQLSLISCFLLIKQNKNNNLNLCISYKLNSFCNGAAELSLEYIVGWLGWMAVVLLWYVCYVRETWTSMNFC